MTLAIGRGSHRSLPSPWKVPRLFWIQRPPRQFVRSEGSNRS